MWFTTPRSIPIWQLVGTNGIAGTFTQRTLNHHFAPSRLTVIAFGSPVKGR
jgi:hypothetical protein